MTETVENIKEASCWVLVCAISLQLGSHALLFCSKQLRKGKIVMKGRGSGTLVKSNLLLFFNLIGLMLTEIAYLCTV